MTRSDHQRDRSTTDSPAHSYLCPYCTTAVYPTEILVRVHISYVADSIHEGRDGMTPEVEPLELDGSGQQVGTAFTLAGQLNLHGLTLGDIPVAYDGQTFDERERRALLVAAFNANKNRSDTELQDQVTAHLEQHDLEPLSARTLRQLCQHVFRPHIDVEGTQGVDEESTGEITTAETALRDLTALQQAIILAHLAQPDIDRTTIATRVGTANSYPTQVINARTSLVARLRSRINGELNLERLVAERVPAEDLGTLIEEGYLDDFDIDLQATHERKCHPPDSATKVTGAGPADSTDSPRPSNEERQFHGNSDDDEGSRNGIAARHGQDRPATGNRRSGEPGTGNKRSDRSGKADTDEGDTDRGSTDEGDTDRGSTDEGDTDKGGPDQTNSNDAAGADTDSEATVPRAEVESIREQVAFDRAVIEQEMELTDPTPQQVRTKAYLEQILDRLDEILS